MTEYYISKILLLRVKVFPWNIEWTIQDGLYKRLLLPVYSHLFSSVKEITAIKCVGIFKCFDMFPYLCFLGSRNNNFTYI